VPNAVYLSHPSSLEHDTGAHPERPERMVAIERRLRDPGWTELDWRLSGPASRAQIEAVHPSRYVTAIEELCRMGGGDLDVDTVVSAGSWEAALHAAGGTVQLVDLLLAGEAPAGFSAHRPPGHHAEPSRAMGFCVFNNVAVAAAHAVEAHALRRVAILDWDVHHGNGTNDIFHSRSDVLYISIHEWPLYPGTGPTEDEGSGAGEGYTINLPVGAGADDALYVSLVERVVVPILSEYEPQLVLVSAGYDAHVRDPLASCRVTEAGYAAMTVALHRLCRRLGIPLGLALEGGYDLTGLSESVAATLEALMDGASPRRASDSRSPHPSALDAARRLSRRWPSLVRVER